jgi:hypothetical protein
MMTQFFRDEGGHSPSPEKINDGLNENSACNGGKEELPGPVGRHLIGLGEQLVHERGTAAGVADNKYRLPDFDILEFWEKYPVQKQGEAGNPGERHEDTCHQQTVKKIPAQAEHLPGYTYPSKIKTHL